MLSVYKVLKKSIFDDLPHGFLNIMSRSYTKEIYERARAVENVHFLKIQREQLQRLRNKMIKELKKTEYEGDVDANLEVKESRAARTQQADN